MLTADRQTGLIETLDARLRATADHSEESAVPVSADQLVEASGLAILTFRRRRPQQRKQVRLHLGFLHSDELVLVREEGKKVSIIYSGDNLRSCLDELQSSVRELQQRRYRSEDTFPTLNTIIGQVAQIVRDRRDARTVLAI